MDDIAAENITVFDGRLDAEGRALVTPVIHVTHVAPGALKASAAVNTARVSCLVSPIIYVGDGGSRFAPSSWRIASKSQARA